MASCDCHSVGSGKPLKSGEHWGQKEDSLGAFGSTGLSGLEAGRLLRGLLECFARDGVGIEEGLSFCASGQDQWNGGLKVQ